MADSTYDSIIICGERFKLKNTRVVTFEDPDGYSFPTANKQYEVQGLRLYRERVIKGQKVKPTDVDKLKEIVHMVVLHTDLTSDAHGCFNALVQRKLSTHFMVEWDGTIYQGLDPAYEAFQAGGDANPVSIGIDLNNPMKNLRREPNAPPYPEGHPALASAEFKKKYRRPRSKMMRINGSPLIAYGYTDAQYQALIQLLTELTQFFKNIKRTFPIDAKGDIIPNVVEGVAGFQGIVCHWQVSPMRWDPGPGFDWQRVYAGLVRENNSFPVVLSDGKTIANLLEKAKVERQAERYYELNEEGLPGEGTGAPTGGWFPVGRNQTWHGGIHLPGRKGREVLAMVNGQLVAARFNAKPTLLGSNNFVVLRHAIEIPGRDKKKKQELIFWSLYMHLDPIDFDEKNKEAWPEWYTKLLRLDAGAAAGEEAGLDSDRKGADDAGGEDAEDEFVADDGDEFQRGPTRQGPGLRFLREGSVAWFDFEDNPIEISSSEPIGTVGEFGEPDDWRRQIHVEIFADDRWKEAIDMAVHGAFFTEVQQSDLGSRSLFVQNRGLLAAFSPSGVGVTSSSLVPERYVSPSEIEDLYTASDDGSRAIKRRLHKLAVKSISEWSDMVDWVQALSDAEDWKSKKKDFKKIMRKSGIFRSALEQVLPYVWLNGEVAQAIGMEGKWSGLVWHFHPIHFLMWLTFHSSRRVQKLSRSVSRKELKKMKKAKEEAIAKAAAEGKTLEGDRDGEDYGASLDDLDVDSVSVDEVLDDWFDERDPGDWRDVRGGLDE